MKKLSFFDRYEWCRLEPLRALIKELRNDILLAYFKLLKASEEDEFLLKNTNLKDKNILIVIAFEQPKALSWLLSLSKVKLGNFDLMVFDNSRNLDSRKDIASLCYEHKIPYLALPLINTKHPNRSHGLAMSWVFHRIIRKIKPNYFGFLDHDMYPVKKIDLSSMIPVNQNLYGSINKASNYWSLWAGYCFFKFKVYGDKSLNFLYDFSRGLDTGGRNWPLIYQFEDEQSIKFASLSNQTLALRDDLISEVQLIDDAWVHVGGVSYNDNILTKEKFHSKLVEILLNGKDFDHLKIKE